MRQYYSNINAIKLTHETTVLHNAKLMFLQDKLEVKVGALFCHIVKKWTITNNFGWISQL
jgi:hypothetical protein